MSASRIICRYLGHKRSKSFARRIDYFWHSECRVCGTPLVRVGPRDWREPARHFQTTSDDTAQLRFDGFS